MRKLKFKGKIYRLIEFIEPEDKTFIQCEAHVIDSKNTDFIYVHSILGYFLYDTDGNRLSEAQGVKWSDENGRFTTL